MTFVYSTGVLNITDFEGKYVLVEINKIISTCFNWTAPIVNVYFCRASNYKTNKNNLGENVKSDTLEM